MLRLTGLHENRLMMYCVFMRVMCPESWFEHQAQWHSVCVKWITHIYLACGISGLLLLPTRYSAVYIPCDSIQMRPFRCNNVN